MIVKIKGRLLDEKETAEFLSRGDRPEGTDALDDDTAWQIVAEVEAGVRAPKGETERCRKFRGAIRRELRGDLKREAEEAAIRT